MNINTGELYSTSDREKIEEGLVEVKGALTEKQKKEMRVSLNDHRSEAGKQLTQERAERGIGKNQIRKLKRKGFLK